LTLIINNVEDSQDLSTSPYIIRKLNI